MTLKWWMQQGSCQNHRVDCVVLCLRLPALYVCAHDSAAGGHCARNSAQRVHLLSVGIRDTLLTRRLQVPRPEI